MKELLEHLTGLQLVGYAQNCLAHPPNPTW